MRACYEMGLLIALHARNLHSEYKMAELKDQFDILEHFLSTTSTYTLPQSSLCSIATFSNSPEQKKTDNNHLSYFFPKGETSGIITCSSNQIVLFSHRSDGCGKGAESAIC